MQGLVIEWVTVKAFHEDFSTENGKVINDYCTCQLSVNIYLRQGGYVFARVCLFENRRGGVGANRKAWAMHVNFSSEDPCCYGNKLFLFEDKIGCRLTRASNAETQLLGYIGYIAWQWDIYLVPQNVFLVYFCHLRLQRTLYKNEL